ncbi:MAG: hypothetical protein V8T10_07385 [Merdibacter sp.]
MAMAWTKRRRVRGQQLLDQVSMGAYADSIQPALRRAAAARRHCARHGCHPKIIYFDEPTSALDPELTQEVLQVMKDLEPKA